MIQQKIKSFSKILKLLLETIRGLGEALNIDNPKIIVGKDCKRQNIWRMNLYPDYKFIRTNHPFLSFFF